MGGRAWRKIRIAAASFSGTAQKPTRFFGFDLTAWRQRTCRDTTRCQSRLRAQGSPRDNIATHEPTVSFGFRASLVASTTARCIRCNSCSADPHCSLGASISSGHRLRLRLIAHGSSLIASRWPSSAFRTRHAPMKATIPARRRPSRCPRRLSLLFDSSTNLGHQYKARRPGWRLPTLSIPIARPKKPTGFIIWNRSPISQVGSASGHALRSSRSVAS
jgi:hypothetical protein